MCERLDEISVWIVSVTTAFSSSVFHPVDGTHSFQSRVLQKPDWTFFFFFFSYRML